MLRDLFVTDPLGREGRGAYAKGLTALRGAHIGTRVGRKAPEWNSLGELVAYTDCSGKTTRTSFDEFG